MAMARLLANKRRMSSRLCGAGRFAMSSDRTGNVVACLESVQRVFLHENMVANIDTIVAITSEALIDTGSVRFHRPILVFRPTKWRYQNASVNDATVRLRTRKLRDASRHTILDLLVLCFRITRVPRKAKISNSPPDTHSSPTRSCSAACSRGVV